MTKIEETRYRRIFKTLGPGNYKRIGREVGVSPQHVSRFLRGIKGATFKMAGGIADSADVDMDDVRWFITCNVEKQLAKAA